MTVRWRGAGTREGRGRDAHSADENRGKGEGQDWCIKLYYIDIFDISLLL